MKTEKAWKITKTVLPQHSDHAGVMWHGIYFNWLEEGRINALSSIGLEYTKLTQKGYEMPLISSSIKYIFPLYLGDKITISSIFNISKSPKINIHSEFLNENKEILTIAEINLVLVNSKNFTIIRKRPDFLLKAFSKLNG